MLNILTLVARLKEPVLILGAGGFVGANLLQRLIDENYKVFGVSSTYPDNWRLKLIKNPNIVTCDVNKPKQIKNLIKKVKPRTIFCLTAYGAYESQKNVNRIHNTNYLSTINILEILKSCGFDAFIHTGSSSEYGLNSNSPKENDELIPNSHYSISKIAINYAIKYYGKIQNLPVLNLRLYSVYGPFEEQTRLIPKMITNGLKKGYSPLVDPSIGRDFVYVDDVVDCMIKSAHKISPKIYGETYNLGSGKETTIGELAFLIKDLFNIKKDPAFSTMEKRCWDHKNHWYANIEKIKKQIGWQPKT